MDQEYSARIRRTRCGAIDDHYYQVIGRKIRSQAFHNTMKGIWLAITGRRRPANGRDMRFHPESSV